MMGLLKKASLLTESVEMPDFFSYCKNNFLSHFCKLENFGSFYFVTESYGFDFESIAKSYSTVDFWNGTIPEKNKSFFFENSPLVTNPLLQFFSNPIQNKIRNINVYAKDNKTIFISCNSEIHQTDFTYNDIQFFNIDKKSNIPLNKYVIDFSDYVENFILSNIEIPIEIQKKTVFNEIKNRIFMFFSETPVILKSENNQIFFYFPETNIDINIYLKHITLSLKDFSQFKYNFNTKKIGNVLMFQEFNLI